MSRESGDAGTEDVNMDVNDGSQDEANVDECSHSPDSEPEEIHQNAGETNKDADETLRLKVNPVNANDSTSVTVDEPSAAVPISKVQVKNNVSSKDKSNVKQKKVLRHAHSSHIEIRIEEDSIGSQGDDTGQADTIEGVDNGSVLNIEVSCSNSAASETGDLDNGKVYSSVLYSCNKCSFCTSKLSELKLHALTEQHENIDTLENDLDENDSDENLLIDYTCSKCSFQTNRFLTYREHLLTHTKISANELFKCLDCDYTTRHKYNLKTHLKRHAKIEELCEDEVFRCEKCDYVSPYKHDLMTHMKKHDPEKPFQCKECDFMSIYKHSLIHHMRSKHEKLRPYKCEQCDYCSARKQDLATHMGRHAEEKKFKCDRCDYATPYRVSFKAHMDRHLGNKLFKCEHEGCDFATTTKQNLKSHELRHAAVKPLKCTLCDFSATHRQQMINHEVKHGLSDTVSRTYKCISCEYTTGHRYSLQRHMKRHKADRKMPDKDFICPVCGYSTGYKNSLKRHMAKHSDVKPFKCGHCEYSAINMTQMHVHIAKHTGIKPFKCDLCTYATANKQHLVGHMAKHSTVRLNCTKCEFSTAWKQRLRAHLKAHETGTLHQKKDPTEASARSDQEAASKDGGDEGTSDKDQALSEISSAIEAFKKTHTHSKEDNNLSVNNNEEEVHENGSASNSDVEMSATNQTAAGCNKDGSLEQVGEVQLIDEDGNKMSATVQCINGKQTIEILVGNGIKQTVALKDLQKEGCQAFIWEQAEEADGTKHIRAVSPTKSNPESESEMSLLVIDEMETV